MATKISCPHCKGTGQSRLEGALLDCLNVIRRIGPATRSQIHAATPRSSLKKEDGVKKITATHKRVQRLNELGLVKPAGNQSPVKWVAV